MVLKENRGALKQRDAKEACERNRDLWKGSVKGTCESNRRDVIECTGWKLHPKILMWGLQGMRRGNRGVRSNTPDESYTRKYSWKDRKSWEGTGGRYIRDGHRFYKQKWFQIDALVFQHLITRNSHHAKIKLNLAHIREQSPLTPKHQHSPPKIKK